MQLTYTWSILYWASLNAGCLVQRTGWTSDPDMFCQWLSAIPFAGGGFDDVAIAEGLSEALMVYKLYTFSFHFVFP